MKKRQGRTVRIVTEELGGSAAREHDGQSQVEEAIFSTIQDKRFYAAEHAPICNGRLAPESGFSLLPHYLLNFFFDGLSENRVPAI